MKKSTKKLLIFIAFIGSIFFYIFIWNLLVELNEDRKELKIQIETKVYINLGTIENILSYHAGGLFIDSDCIIKINNNSKILTGIICNKIEIGKDLYYNKIITKQFGDIETYEVRDK